MRGIRQITGESEFGEVFFDGALAKREHIVGKIGEGWRIAMTVLAYERGASALTDPARNDSQRPRCQGRGEGRLRDVFRRSRCSGQLAGSDDAG